MDRIKEIVLLEWNRHREGIINAFGTYIGDNIGNGQGLKSNDDNITIRSFSGARIRAKAERVYRK